MDLKSVIHERKYAALIIALIIAFSVLFSVTYHPLSRVAINSIECTMKTDKENYFPGETAHINITIKNTGHLPVRLHLRSYDWNSFRILSEKTGEYMNSDNAGLIPRGKYSFSLSGGEKMRIHRDWDFFKYKGGGCIPPFPVEPVEPGNYTLRFNLNLDPDYYGDKSIEMERRILLENASFREVKPQSELVESDENGWNLTAYRNPGNSTLTLHLPRLSRLTKEEAEDITLEARIYENAYIYLRVNLSGHHNSGKDYRYYGLNITLPVANTERDYRLGLHITTPPYFGEYRVYEI